MNTINYIKEGVAIRISDIVLKAKQFFYLIAAITTFNTTAQQIDFEEVQNPLDGVKEGSIAFADVDNDGDLDVLITGDSGPTPSSDKIAKLYTNDGSGNFIEVNGTPFEGVKNSSIAFADIEGDGDQDVLITGDDNSGISFITKLYTNDGSGNFTEVTGTPFDVAWHSSIAFADVDSDGDQDVLITGLKGPLGPSNIISKLYTNDGSGNFTEVSNTPFEEVWFGSIAFADVDGDNDQDVLITGIAGTNPFENKVSKLYTNDGSGNFTEISTPFDGVSQSSVAFADVDGDGDQDVLITGRNNSNNEISKLYINDGSGNFTEVSGTPFDGVSNGSIAFADVDIDGDPDLLITGLINAGGPEISNLYTNDGNGDYTLENGTPFNEVYDSSIAFADVDGDGDQDVLITGFSIQGTISKIYRNLFNTLGVANVINGKYTKMTIFPNPTSGKANIQMGDIQSEKLEIKLSNISGQVIFRETRNYATHFSIDINGSAGIYFLEIITDNDKKFVRRIIKK